VNEFKKAILVILLAISQFACASFVKQKLAFHEPELNASAEVAYLYVKDIYKVDDKDVPKKTTYLAIKPGIHELRFLASGHFYSFNTNAYLKAKAGRIYTVSMQEVVDVTAKHQEKLDLLLDSR